jgi:hypothetical protein
MRRLLAAGLVLAACSAPDPYPKDGTLRLNHLQMKGTHNSYHLRPDPLLRPEFDYEHPTLTNQLEKEGVRQFELDVHWMRDDQRFAVFHLPSLDERSSCHWFTDCLAELRAWSDAHPLHEPLFIFVETKDDIDPDPIAPHLDALDVEALSGWPRARVLTPDDVQGTHATLADAVTTAGWPTLRALRGHVLFVMIDKVRAPGASHYEYTHAMTSLKGRAMFITADRADPYAAVLSLENSVDDADATVAAVKAGFIVRTNVEDPVKDGKATGPTPDRDAALAGAAHILSSNFPVPLVDGGYSLDLAGGTPSRCHPLVAPAGCASGDIEAPAHLVE